MDLRDMALRVLLIKGVVQESREFLNEDRINAAFVRLIEAENRLEYLIQDIHDAVTKEDTDGSESV